MSSITVANIAFETSDSNVLESINGSLAIVAGNNNTFLANSTFVAANIVSIGSGNIANDVLTTSNVTTVTTTTNGQVIFSGNVSPTMLSASTSDWNPLVGNAYFVRVSSNTALTLYGMVEGTNNQVIVLNNIGNSAITLSNEDAANENTASRRFRLPDNITVYPASSISLIYDGNVQRWKTQNSTGTNFFHKTALIKGFFSGGGLYRTNACRISYATETNAAVPGANLVQGRIRYSALGNACKGFFAAGAFPNVCTGITTVERTTYTTETNAAVTTNLNFARRTNVGAGNSCKGFIASGLTTPTAPSGIVTTTCRITYSTETNAVAAGACLTASRSSAAQAVGNACKGFFAGGFSPVPSTSAERITYATETNAAAPGAFLTIGRYQSASAGNACKGFISSGRSCTPVPGTYFTTTDRITYATETTAAVPGASLVQFRYQFNAAGNACKGFYAGGSPGPRSTAERITYSTETNAVAAGACLSVARGCSAAV